MIIKLSREEVKQFLQEGLKSKYGAVVPEDNEISVEITYNNEAEISIRPKEKEEAVADEQ